MVEVEEEEEEEEEEVVDSSTPSPDFPVAWVVVVDSSSSLTCDHLRGVPSTKPTRSRAKHEFLVSPQNNSRAKLKTTESGANGSY